MAEFTADKVILFGLFFGDFLFRIPNYQRPYEWGLEDCQQLWDDLYEFAFPDDKPRDKNDKTKYYLGSIIISSNENQDRQEVIDGQQRLTSLTLLLKALHDSFGKANINDFTEIKNNIKKCLFKSDLFGGVDEDIPKIETLINSGKDQKIYIDILKNGCSKSILSSPKICKNISLYTLNYKFFFNKISEILLKDHPGYLEAFIRCLLENIQLLCIKTETVESALQIFSTTNDRGKPLLDADIFKSKIFDFNRDENGQIRDDIIQSWQEIKELAEMAFPNEKTSPLDELFTRYMYYSYAKIDTQEKRVDFTRMKSMRSFYAENNYSIFRDPSILNELNTLAQFWSDVNNRDKEKLGEDILKQFNILNFAPNKLWTYVMSVYYLCNPCQDDIWPEEYRKQFLLYLEKLTGFVLAYSLINPGISAIKKPLFDEIKNIPKKGKDSFVSFIDIKELKRRLNEISFENTFNMTKPMLTWWAYQYPGQPLLSDSQFDIEHIYSQKLAKAQPLTPPDLLDTLGNKSLLKKRINIAANDHWFKTKKEKYYIKSEILELQNMYKDEKYKEIDLFNGKQIQERNEKIHATFIEYLRQYNILKE